MRIWIMALASLSLLACSPPAAEEQAREEAAQAVAATGCAASARAAWRAGGVEFETMAMSEGATCADASATISIGDPTGRQVFSETYTASQVMVLAGASDASAMQTALSDWLDQSHAVFRDSSDLPEWRADQENPVNGEFAFYPEPTFHREAYAALRTRDAPVFCFVQGMESLSCLVWENGAFTKVGVQTFPG